MMEDGLDDLFGEAPSLQIPAPLPKGLLQRVDEQCVSGCRQKLVWSRAGCLAYLSGDGRNVILQHLICDARDGHWTLSKQYEIHNIRAAHGESDLVHLCWSHIGSELAVVDIVGRVSVHQIMLAMNRLVVFRRCMSDPEDNLSSVVGMMWLHTHRADKQEFFYKPIVKANEVWNFSCTPQKLGGPFVPNDRPGYVSVTRGGMLKVVFQSTDRWSEAKAELKSIGGASELLTHAAICPDKSGEKKDGLYIVTHSSKHEVRVYRISLDLEHLKIQSQLLKTLSNFGPKEADSETLSTGHGRSFNLSFLDIVPSGPESKSRAPTKPFVLAGFSHITDDIHAGGDQSTIVCRLELYAGKPGLHTSFNALTAKKNSSSPELPNEYSLIRSDDIVIPRTLLTIQQFNVGTVLSLTFSDGSVEFRDRTTMDLLGADMSEDQISSLHQIGFNFLGVRPCLHAVLSPNAAALFTLDENHVATLNVLQYSNLDNIGMLDNSSFNRICEGFVLQCSYACFVHWNYIEDLLYAMQTFSNQYLIEHMQEGGLPNMSDRSTFNAHLLSETYRILGIKVDHSIDPLPDNAFRSHHLQRCLNTQASLGHSGNYVNRSLPALVAYTMLNARYCAILFVSASNSNKNPNVKPPPGAPESEIKNPETVHFLLGLVKYYMDVLSYLVDEIFTLSDHFSDAGTLSNLNAYALNQHLRATNSPALLLLLASTSRVTLRFDCKLMRVLAQESKAHASHTSLGRVYREMDAIHAKAPVDLQKATDLLSSIDTKIKEAYKAAGLGDATSLERQTAEKGMLIKAEIPEVLIGVVKDILGPTADALRDEVNVAELYFADVGWLGLTDGVVDVGAGMRVRRRRPIDAMRKVEMRKEVKVRRCTRCCALMEDHIQGRGAGMFVMGMQRDCFCGGRWMVLDGTEEGGMDV